MNIRIENNSIIINYKNDSEYDNAKNKVSDARDDFIQKNNFYYQFIDDEKSLIFFYKNNRGILYELCEKILYHAYLSLKIITKDILNEGIKIALKTLESKKFLFMINNQRKFLIEFSDEKLILHPIYNQSFNSMAELYEYYKIFFKVSLSAIEGFVRTRMQILEQKIYVEYYDAIDQFFYLIQCVLSDPQLFEQDFDKEIFMQQLVSFIIKNIAIKELQSLQVDFSYDHPLNNYRYVTLLTHKLFSKLSLDGSLSHLNQNDIEQIADAITYSGDFKSLPSIISNAYDKLNKAMPFKTIEKILKRQRNVEYLF